jgi:hypothetical protein
MTIPGTRTKGHRELRLTLAPAAVEILREVPRREGRVFERRGGWNNPMIALHRRIALISASRYRVSFCTI